MEQKDSCLNCGAELNGKFCYACGQKRIDPHERTFKYFIYQFFGAAFFLENNLLKNLFYLLFRPGLMATEYLHGRRKSYMAPLSLFLLINLVYFFSVTLSDLNLTLSEQLTQPHHVSWAQAMVDRKIVRLDTTYDKLKVDYNEQSTSLSKTLIILHAPILAMFLMLLYYRKNYYYSDHIILSIYLIAFILLFNMLVFLTLLAMVRVGWISVPSLFKISSILFILALPPYFYLSIKKFYQQKIVWSLVKTLLVIIAFVLSHLIYRTLLFLIVISTL